MATPIENNTTALEALLEQVQALPPAPQTQTKTLTLGAAAPQAVTPDSGKVLSSVPVVLDTSIVKAENIAKNVTMLGITGTHEGGGSSGYPIEVATSAEMDTVATAANVGKAYKFTGTTDSKYTNGDIYIVEAS